MKKEEYESKRTEMFNEAEQLLNEGKFEESNEKIKEIENFDKEYETFVSNEATTRANMNALKNTAKVIPAVASIMSNSATIGIDLNRVGSNGADSIGYRTAFMNYVLKNEKIPDEFRNSDEVTKTSDIGSVIPETVLNKIIEKLESVGMILPLVTRTSYKGGLKIPTSTVKPIATWVNEGSGSDTIKKTTGSISFAYNKLRCAIAVSLEVDTMALSAFETAFVNNVTEAMTKALEQSIISGTGSGQPRGILTETVETGQNVDIAADGSITYGILIDCESALPLAYETGAVWCMSKKTFMQFAGMLDSNGQPIARVNYGIGGKAERMLLGRNVILTEYVPNYADTVASDTVVAFMFNFKDYVLNTNLNMTIKKYEDNETDDLVTKAIMLVDGKVIDKNSLVTLTKKA